MKKISIILFMLVLAMAQARAQGDTEAALLLDLKKTRADYEVAKQKFENDTKLFNEKAISPNDYNRSKNELLSREVDYQKLILKLISQQSYITVERAVKYQDKRGNRKVKITLKSALEGNEEYLAQFEDHFDVFTPEMRSGKIYNIYVSLVDNDTKTIIGTPYEFRVPAIGLGKLADADFELLKDAESLTVGLNYNNRKDEKNIYLKKDASMSVIDIASMQFSQEADLNSKATYDIALERFSTSDDVYRLEVKNLPRQISYDFADGGSKVSQIRFAQGMNVKRLSLQLYLPDKDDEEIVIDQPIKFQVDAITASTGEKAGSEQLEIIPRGRGKIEVRANNLYHETTTGKPVEMDITVRNGGSRRLDNIRITAEKPLGWETVMVPNIIRSLDPEKEEVVKISIVPPKEGGVGAQEVKIKTEATADNRKVDTEDKTIRIQVNAATSILGTIVLIALLLGIIGGVVWFGMKLSRR
ncbi:NEW3 domain-containing protein [Bacteroides sp. OttesenSCG-928-D19]|nr:NEW3 domain-containing protein [Bacteroides sp. OttesenSCG-928-D19]